MDVKKLSESITYLCDNYSHQFFAVVSDDKKLCKICTSYLNNVKELNKLYQEDAKEYYKTIIALVETNIKEIVYFAIVNLIYHCKNEKKVIEILEHIEFGKLTSTLTLKKLTPFRLYAMTSLSIIQNVDKSRCGDIFFRNNNFHSMEEMYTFLVYHYLGSPFLLADSRNVTKESAIQLIKSLPKDIKHVLLLNMFVHFATHKATKNYIDINKLFFNTHQAEFDLGNHFKELYDMMADCLDDINETSASKYIRLANKIAFSRYKKSNVEYDELFKDLSFLGEDDETMFDIEERLNHENPTLVKKIMAYLRKLVKKNGYLSTIDKQSDLLVKKLLPLLREFSKQNYQVSFKIHELIMSTYNKDEDLLNVTLNKIKDMRSFESLALCVVLNLGNNDVVHSRLYIDKFVKYDTTLRKDLDKLAFNFAKFLKYYLLTKDYDNDTGVLLNMKHDNVYHYDVFESVSDFTNYIYNRFMMLNSLNLNPVRNELFEAIYVVNNLFLYFVYNHSLDSALRLNYNIYHNFDKLRSSLKTCEFIEELEIVEPILQTVEQEIEKNRKRIDINDINLEEILDMGQFTKMERINNRLLNLHSVDEYNEKLHNFAYINKLVK